MIDSTPLRAWTSGCWWGSGRWWGCASASAWSQMPRTAVKGVRPW